MKTIFDKVKLVTLMVTALSMPLSGCDNIADPETGRNDEQDSSEPISQQDPSNLFYHLDKLPVEELSGAETRGLLFLREEEKLAHDLYISLNEIIPLRPLQNISKSEQQHMDAVKYLLDRYKLDDPASDEVGIFNNTELQALYNTLLDEGSRGRIEALTAGALVEETDIADIEDELKNIVDNQDLQFVYNNLLRASENHLRAFTRVLRLNGVEYTPKILTMERYKIIIGEE